MIRPQVGDKMGEALYERPSNHSPFSALAFLSSNLPESSK